MDKFDNNSHIFEILHVNHCLIGEFSLYFRGVYLVFEDNP